MGGGALGYCLGDDICQTTKLMGVSRRSVAHIILISSIAVFPCLLMNRVLWPTLFLCGCRSSAARQGKKRLLDKEEAPAGPTRRVTRRLATQGTDPQLTPLVSAAETESKASSSSASRLAGPPAQSSAMHTPTDRESDSVTPAARAVTRAAAAAGVSQPEAVKAGSRAGTTPAGKPPLPPTASKAVSAYRSAQRQKDAPTASKAPAGKTKASSPGTAPASSPAYVPASMSGCFLAAAAAADDATARPVTRRSVQQLLTSSGPSGTSWERGTASPLTTRGRSKEGAADHPDGASRLCASASHDRSAEAKKAQPAAAGQQGGGSKKRSAEVPLSQLASQGELC